MSTLATNLSSVDLLSQRYVLDIREDDEFLRLLLALAQNPEHTAAILYQAWVRPRLKSIAIHAPDLYHGLFLVHVKHAFPGLHIPGLEKAIFHGYDTKLTIVPLASIAREDVSWLWEPYVPFKKVTLVEGDPGVGKTYLMLALTSAVTRGYSLPDQRGRVASPDSTRLGNVLYLTAEDGLGDTIRPRAEKVDTDLNRFYVPLSTATISLAHPESLEAAIKEYEAKLVILDPLTAFLGADMDMHRANEVRPMMSVLSLIASQYNCAILALRHWTKTSGGRAKYRGQGNIDFTAAARSVLVVGESPEDDRLRILAQSKNSLTGLGKSIVFQISEEGLTWAGTSELSADDLSQMQPTKRQHQRKEAFDWLKAYLHDGPQPSQAIIEAAKAVGIPERTLWRAKELLGILAAKEGRNWYWRLPKFAPWDRHADEQDDHGIEV